ncbi:MAG: tripartite tricarboxylate transporter permease [Verrucomicrobiales bacterium]|nr:tripartite tricarboxylate transporter permease [Verrucomicrobiales bacterium]
MIALLELFFWILLGTALGISVGAIPGLTGAMLIALIVPHTENMNANPAFALLVGMYVGSVSGGLITATLLKMPGTPASIITTLDGHPMAAGGRPGRALGLGIGASLVGGLISWLALFLLSKPVANASTLLGPFDYFALILMALVFIATVSDRGPGGLARGIFSGMLGCVAAAPGAHPATGELRLTFGMEEMNDGFKAMSVLIGMFAFSEAIRMALRPGPPKADAEEVEDRLWLPVRFWLKKWGNLIRSSLIGTWVGVLPGIGANIGSTVAYGSARQLSKTPDEFGTGCDDGVIASESANNATVGGALIPLIALGIPGSVIDAILLGAFVIHGLQPGPLLFKNAPEAVATISWSYLVANLVMAGLMLASARWISKLSNVPRGWLAPVVILFCVIGSFALSNRMFDVWVMVGFGVVGLLFSRLKIPAAPFVIGFVLAPLAEEKLASGIMTTGGSIAPLFTRPFSIACLVFAIALAVWPLISRKKGPNTPVESA